MFTALQHQHKHCNCLIRLINTSGKGTRERKELTSNRVRHELIIGRIGGRDRLSILLHRDADLPGRERQLELRDAGIDGGCLR
jgi:hypothetical protein